MTKFSADKVFGIAISAAISASFIVTSDVTAAPTFPPQHFSDRAEFVEPAESSATHIASPWYRQTQIADRRVIDFLRARDGNRFVFLDPKTGPWYRVTN